jgi:hypothetical protein
MNCLPCIRLGDATMFLDAELGRNSPYVPATSTSVNAPFLKGSTQSGAGVGGAVGLVGPRPKGVLGH